MKNLFFYLTLAIMLLVSVPAKSQLKFGVQAGANFSDVKLKHLTTKTATGWYVGPTASLSIPIIGLGVEGSVWYSRYNTEVDGYKDIHVSYISVPLNLRYQIQLPYIQPYAFFGPEFDFNVEDNWPGIHDYTTSLNAGFGAELFDKIQISCGYNWGLGGSDQQAWRVGLGYFF